MKYYKVSEERLLELLAKEKYIEALADDWAAVDPTQINYDEYIQREFIPIAKKNIIEFEENKPIYGYPTAI